MSIERVGGYLIFIFALILIGKDVKLTTGVPPTPTTTTHYPWKFYNPHYGYEPYWAGADWIFSERQREQQEAGSIPPYICNDPCPWVYWRVGQICAVSKHYWNYYGPIYKYDRCHPYTEWTQWVWDWFGAGEWICHGNQTMQLQDEFVTFRTYCGYLDAKCKGSTKPEKYQYYFVHLGPCVRYQADVYRSNTRRHEPAHFVKRQSNFIKQFSDKMLTAITTLKPYNG